MKTKDIYQSQKTGKCYVRRGNGYRLIDDLKGRIHLPIEFDNGELDVIGRKPAFRGKEEKAIADNMRDLWKHQTSLAD